jgi:major vault protein
MPNEERGSKDLVLAPGEYAYVADDTKGLVDVCVGPFKVSLANTERPVVFSYEKKRFRPSSLDDRTLFTTAPEGWYIVLKNPAPENKHPGANSRPQVPSLQIGRKINVPGPDSFALWPGQMARVLQGHHIRSNQYLVVRVYDEAAAKENWTKAVIKPSGGEAEGTAAAPEKSVPDLKMGQLSIIKGTDVSFFIPPTGVEVVPDVVPGEEKKQYVREAVTLERLEYCVLLDEDGNKRTETGPSVVFPEPTEKFVEKTVEGRPHRKFRAIELNDNSGIYVKVIAPYTDGDTTYAEGEELFITGKTQKIYFPREEHAIIKYGDREIHFATAIPAGEGRYVLNRDTGEIRIEHGPAMFLPDPRREVMCRRILDPKVVNLLYPGNTEALEFNAGLARQMVEQSAQNAKETASDAALYAAAAGSSLTSNVMGYGNDRMLLGGRLEEQSLTRSAKVYAGDAINRKQGYTEPRTILLNTRYQGVVTIEPWVGYAVMLVRKSGERRVVVGPQSVMLEYDEQPQIMQLSTGTPKNDQTAQRTAYLCVHANRVSDLIHAETKDLVAVDVRLSYRVNFEGDDPEKWFKVDNYIKLLCDHMRSRIRNRVMRLGIEEFYKRSIDILRDEILGAAQEGRKRPGTPFEENGMRIYDVEILDVTIDETSGEVEELLVDGQRNTIREQLELDRQKRKLDYTVAIEQLKRLEYDAQAETGNHHIALKVESAKLQLQLDILLARNGAEAAKARGEQALTEKQAQLAVLEAEFEQEMTAGVARVDLERRVIENRLFELSAETEAVTKKAGAVSPGLIAALSTFSDRELVGKLAEAMAPIAILRKTGVNDVMAKLLEGTSLAKALKSGILNGVTEDAPSMTNPPLR